MQCKIFGRVRENEYVDVKYSRDTTSRGARGSKKGGPTEMLSGMQQKCNGEVGGGGGGGRVALVCGNTAREVSDDLGRLLHGEMNLVKIIQDPLHLLRLPMQRLRCLCPDLDGVFHNLHNSHSVSYMRIRGHADLIIGRLHLQFG